MSDLDCQECGMLVEPAGAFHDYTCCLIYKASMSHEQVKLYTDLRAQLAAEREAREKAESIDAAGAGWIIEWMLADKYRKPDTPALVQQGRRAYRETLDRAEKAERERDEAQAELASWRWVHGDCHWHKEAERLAAELARVREAVKMLCHVWAQIDQWVRQYGYDSPGIDKYPVVQGTRSQMRLTRIARLPRDEQAAAQALKDMDPQMHDALET